MRQTGDSILGSWWDMVHLPATIWLWRSRSRSRSPLPSREKQLSKSPKKRSASRSPSRSRSRSRSKSLSRSCLFSIYGDPEYPCGPTELEVADDTLHDAPGINMLRTRIANKMARDHNMPEIS